MENPAPQNQREKYLANHYKKVGRTHCKPSPDTKAFMDEQKVQTAIIQTEFKNLSLKLDGIAESNRDSNKRIKTLETWRTLLIGVWIATSFFSTAVVPALGYYFLKTTRYEILEEARSEIDISLGEFITNNFEEYNE